MCRGGNTYFEEHFELGHVILDELDVFSIAVFCHCFVRQIISTSERGYTYYTRK